MVRNNPLGAGQLRAETQLRHLPGMRFIDSRETEVGFCFELPGRGACLSLLITKALLSIQQSLADDRAKMSFMDRSAL